MKKLTYLVIATAALGMVACTGGNKAGYVVTCLLYTSTNFLLPVTIQQASGGMGLLKGSKTICYIVRRSSAITTAVSLSNNYFEVPGFEKDSPTADVVNGLTQLTFEAIIRVNRFDPKNEISTIMGIEQYCLFRLGDSGSVSYTHLLRY